MDSWTLRRFECDLERVWEFCCEGPEEVEEEADLACRNLETISAALGWPCTDVGDEMVGEANLDPGWAELSVMEEEGEVAVLPPTGFVARTF